MTRTTMLIAATVLAVSLTSAPGATATPSSCSLDWGSQEHSSSSTETFGRLAGLRSGQHACFDRVVLDFAGELPSYSVQYVDEVVAEGTGEPLMLRGEAFLQVSLLASPYAGDHSTPLLFDPAEPAELVDTTGHEALRQVAWGNAFEGHSRLGIGARARLPVRVMELDGPGSGSRLVIDIAHRW